MTDKTICEKCGYWIDLNGNHCCDDRLRIHCYRCGADGPIIPYAEDTKFWTWNTRAGESHD